MPQKKENSRKHEEELDMSPPEEKVRDNIAKLDSADSDIVHVRRVVAGNPNTPLSVLSRLANDECETIRRSVAENPKTPKEMLQALAKDISSEVRLAVAENPHTPSEILVVLAADLAVDVRYGVAENPHMPEGILLKLTKDDNPYVRCRALKTLQMLAPDVQTRLAFMMQGPLEL